MNTPVPAKIPTRPVEWLIGALVLVVLPHALRQPWWVSGGFVLLALWRLFNAWRGWPLPDRNHRRLVLLKYVLALTAFVSVYRAYGGVFGRDAGVSLLIILLGLKLVEMGRAREYYLAAFLGFFLVVTHFFYSQGIPSALYMLLAVGGLIAGLVAFNDPRGSLPVADRLRLVARLMAQALPLMIVAFVFFPRPSKPLWHLPKDVRSAVSGLSEEMSPGKLSELTLSDAVAFRVSFVAAIPAQNELYWRGPVMVTTDGRTWTPGSAARNVPAPPIGAQGPRYEYSVTLEAHNQRWLYVLEHPSSLPPAARLTRDLRVVTDRPVSERMRYAAQSYTHTFVAEANFEELREATQLPAGAHRRARALAHKWRTELRSDAALVQRALDYFRNQPFHYTLTPPEIQGDAVDEFLFSTREGFCEHYAAAFTVLMRAAGVPARVVTGYQGGDYNPVGDYLIVRERDAHAWTEVWLGRRGWVRVDPTAAVSPTRVARGIEEALSLAVGNPSSVLDESTAMRALWRPVRHTFDAINNRWNIWVIGYNARRQEALFEGFGVGANRRSLVLGLLAGLAIALGVVAAIALRGTLPRRDMAQRAYARFCRKLARLGYPRAAHEGPLDFARRVSVSLPRLGADVRAITELYAQTRYGSSQNPDNARALTIAVRKFG
ncbi:MAG: transglutaminase TgpA family protein [Chromatiales bacterium]